MTYERNGKVETVQVARKARMRGVVAGPNGIYLGMNGIEVQKLFGSSNVEGGELSYPLQSGVRVFFGLDKLGNVDRYGATLGDSELPPYIRWYQNSGREAVRPFAIDAGTLGAENAAEQRHLDLIGCAGRESRNIIGRDRVGNLETLETQCGHGSFKEPFFFKIVAFAPGAHAAESDALDSGSLSASPSPEPLATHPPLYRPGGFLPPRPSWTLAEPKRQASPGPRSSPNVSSLLRLRGRQIVSRGIVRNAITPFAASPPPVLMTGYSDSPNGRRYGPAYESLVSEFSYSTNITPTSFQLWAIGQGDPNLQGACHPYYVADPFVNQYLIAPLPTPAPLPSPQPFPTIEPFGNFAARVVLGASHTSSRLGRFQRVSGNGQRYGFAFPQNQMSGQQQTMVTRKIGDYSIKYYPQEFSSVDPTDSHYVLAADCPFGDPSSNKCQPDNLNKLTSTATAWCPQGSITCVLPQTLEVAMAMYVGNTIYLSNPVEYQTADDPRNFEHTGIGASNSVGNVDPVSGTLFERHTDIKLSGPMGIEFSRWYDSRNSTYSHSNLGNGWRHSYSNYLDLSAKCSARVAYVDGEGNKEYFSGIVPGNYAYDQLSGNTLTWNANDTYTLTTWDSQQKTFNNWGGMLTESDRYGNTQTLSYNASGQLSTVVDALGRTLTFSYNGTAQLTGVSVASGPSASFTYGCNNSLCTATEPDGGKWTYSYSTLNYGAYLTKVVDPNNKTSVQTTYSTVQLPYSQDGSPNWPSYRVATQEGGGSQNKYTFTYQFNQNGSPDDGLDNTVVTDSLGRATYFTWSMGLQQITDVVGPLCNCDGGERHYTYDEFGRLTSENDGASQKLDYTFGDDIISQGTYGGSYGPPIAYSQLAIPNMTEVSDLGYAYGRKKDITYGQPATNTQDLPTKIVEPSSYGGNSKITTYQYTANGEPTSIAVTGYSNGFANTYTNAATYDSRGRVLTTKGPRTDVNETTTYKYYSDTDSDLKRRGQLDTITDALNHVTTFGATGSYDWFGNPLSVKDPNNVVVEGTFDALGRQTSNTVEATGSFAAAKTSIAYDKLGQPTSVTLPNGNGSSYTRDSTERLTARIATDSSKLQHEQLNLSFDAMSEPIAMLKQGCTTPASTCASWVTGNANEFAFDSHARLSQMTYGPAATATDETLLTYNDPPNGAPGTLSSIVSGKIADLSAGNSGVLGHLYYYSNTRLPSTDYYVNYGSSASGFGYSWSESFNYDVLNNLTSVVPYSGPNTSYTYDDWNRRTTTLSSVYGSISDHYDPSGNITSETDSDGNLVTYTYDALERPLTATATRSGATTETITWTYDDPTAADLGIGRVWKVSDPSGSQSFTYEPRGKIASNSQTVTGKTTYTTSYTYDGDGNVLTMTYPSGRVVSYTYDFLDRPLSVKSSTTTYVSGATYAPMGPRTSTTYGNGMVETLALDKNYLVSELIVTGASGTKLVDRGYLRDGQHRITSITDNLAAGYDLAYTFSNFGISAANSGASLWGTESIVTDAYWFNVLSQQFSAYHGASYGLGLNQGTNPWQPTQTNTNNTDVNIGYDPNGNITSFLNQTYTYSPRNLISSGEGLSYTYNSGNQRVLATGASGSRAYVYDDTKKLLAESAATNSSTGYEYIYLDGQPVAQEDIGGSTHWTAQDHIGTPILQTNSSDALYWYADYEPFGNVYALRTADAHQPLRRPGQEATLITGTTGPNGDSQLYYNGARWYLPRFGRYVEPDPTGLTNSIENPYAYTFVDPVDQNDADGEKVFFATHVAFEDAFGRKFGHAYLVLMPDDLSAFRNDRRFHVNGTCASNDPMNAQATISGEDVIDPANPAAGFRLESVPNADLTQDRNNLQQIQTPTGMTDTQFINELLNTDDLYGATNGAVTYDPLAGSTKFEDPNAYNSNSYLHSVLKANGIRISIPQLLEPTMLGLGLGSYSGYLPGWDKILDLERGSDANRFNCELAAKGSTPASVGYPLGAVTIIDGGVDDSSSSPAGGSF